MKPDKNNKYNNWKVIGASILLSAGLLFSGCTEATATEMTPTIEPTSTMQVTPTPTSTPIATPVITPEPTLTPILELSREEELALLGLNNLEQGNTLLVIDYVIYELNGETKITFAYLSYNEDHFQINHYFTGEKMFGWETPNTEGLNLTGNPEKYIPINESLNGAKVKMLFPIAAIYEDYENIELFNNIPLIEEMHNELIDGSFENHFMNNLEVANLYLDLVPKQYRVKASDLNLELTLDETPKVKTYE